MITGIIQARIGSTRLPGKANKPIVGTPMLVHEIERVSKTTKVDRWIVATTTKSDDDIVAEMARLSGAGCFRGDETDVLDRYYHAAKQIGVDTIVRITGDCPLHDPHVVDLVVERFQKQGVDYTQTPTNFPEGVDTEVFSFTALEAAWKEARLPSEREHVTLFIKNHPERFKLDAPWTAGETDCSSMHWSVDTEKDFEFVTKIFEHFGNNSFTMNDVIELLKERPELLDIHKGGTGFEGLAKSLQEDEVWKKSHE